MPALICQPLFSIFLKKFFKGLAARGIGAWLLLWRLACRRRRFLKKKVLTDRTFYDIIFLLKERGVIL
jgi:hypothetical protein